MVHSMKFSNQSHHELSSHERRALQERRSHQSLQALYRAFQRKYSMYFIFALVGPLTIFMLPCLYFIHQNYEIFQSLAYDVRPEMVQHLDREAQALTIFFFLAMGLTITACYWLTKRLTKLMISPVSDIERHMRKITAGDWTAPDFKHRLGQEFQSLSSSYSYLYRTLRVHNQKEVETLEKLMNHLQAHSQLDKNAEIILKNLILNKKTQLGINVVEIKSAHDDLKISSAPETRHAS